MQLICSVLLTEALAEVREGAKALSAVMRGTWRCGCKVSLRGQFDLGSYQ